MSDEQPTDLDMDATIRGFVAGQKMFGRYVLKRVLGRGGMGVVWLAGDETLGVEVALKFLPDVVARDQEAIGELKRETLRSRELRHPGIVAVYEFMQDERAAAIVMEYVDGATLSEMKSEEEGGCFEAEQVRPWVEQLCEVLAYAHQRARVVHRDLKPRNLMVTREGMLKVADFGIARSMSDSLSRVSMRMGTSGTPPYMSPQQDNGEPASVTDDIYAAGATIYDLLTGKPPFYSGNISRQIHEKKAPAMEQRRRELNVEGRQPIPAAWEETVAACLAKDPAQRPQSAGEIWERLNAPPSVPRVVQAAVPRVVQAAVPRVAQAAVLIKFECPHCGQRVSALAKAQGQHGICPACAKEFVVPWEQGENDAVPEVMDEEPVDKVLQVRQTFTDVGTAVRRRPLLIVALVMALTFFAGSAGWWFGIEAPARAQREKLAVEKSVAEEKQRQEADAARIAEEARRKKEADDIAERERRRVAKEKADAEEKQRQMAAAEADRLARQKAEEEKARLLVNASKEKPLINSLGMEFVPVAGTGVLFCRWETRVRDYGAFALATGRAVEYPDFAQTGDHPAVNVSWEDAKAFCEWLSKKEGREYRLPSDAEWSVAVGLPKEDGATPSKKDGKIAEAYPWGVAWPPPNGAGDYGSSLSVDKYEKTSPVGSFAANGLGIYDLGGNVWEWCEDWYDSKKDFRVLRGASWSNGDSILLRSSFRFNDLPGIRDGVSGFRVVLVVSGR